MNTKRKATAAVLFILMLTVVSVGVVVAHHNGLYLNYDSGKQKAQAGKENYAHLWWVQYDANMYWKADSPLRSDVMSAIDDQTVAVAEEEDSKNETEQDSQGSEVGEGQTAEDEVSPPEDLKVVMSIKDGRATVGVQRPSSDPYIEPVDATELSGVTQEVLAVVERARAKWEDAPKYPAYVRPAASTGRRGRRGQGASAGCSR